jgi:MoaA/NifB/PqqE/SkfB family radical SAM enzyme
MNLSAAARQGFRLLAARLRGTAVPFHVTLYVNTACNLRCVYCSSPDQRVRPLTADQLRRILDELRGLGTERVLFFGGEPLLRGDLAGIVAHARALGLRCALTTNGTLVPRRPDVVRQLQSLVVSLDGDAEAHDKNRGPGSHADAIMAIRVARDWGVTVRVNAVLNANSAGSLAWLLAFSRRERIPVTLNLMRSEDTGLWKHASAHRLEDGRMRGLIREILEARRSNPWIVFSRESYEVAGQWPDFTRDRRTLAEVGRRFVGPRCSAGRFHCVIYADGSLFPCTLTVQQMDALNVVTAGVAAALGHARAHGCATCFSPCMLEQNALFALHPRVVLNLARTAVRHGLT